MVPRALAGCWALVLVSGTSGAATAARPPVLSPSASAAVATEIVEIGSPPTARALAAVPGYGHPGGFVARTRPGSGATETSLSLPVGRAGHVLWGDWWGRGTQTPALFKGGEWRLYGAPFGFSTVQRTVHFGRRGDRPVVGDWNADGRTDLGVVRGRTWGLAVRLTAQPAVWRELAFGPRGGQPVAGDWNGSGPDGLAVYRAGEWWVKQTADRRAPVRKARFAFYPSAPRNVATAVAGDWDGDGRTGLALVRGDLWKMTPRIGAEPSRVTQRRVARPAGGEPVVWTQAAGPRGTYCPTATGRAGPEATTSTPAGLHPPAQPPEIAQEPSNALVREALLRAERFMLGTSTEVPWAPDPGQRYADVLAGDTRQEFAVRRPAMAAVAVSVAAATDIHDEAEVRASRDSAVAYVEQTVRSIACQHLSVSPGGWGHRWQTGHWAQMTALAAWLIWDELDPATKADVTQMLLDEADHQLTQPAEYWRDRLGNQQPGREGNTAAEEMAWDVPLLELAHTMFPNATHATDYRQHAVQWAVAAYSTPRDLLETRPVNGVPPATRLTGSNALDDGTVVNHHRLEPDYMGNIQHLWWAADFALLARTSTPEAVWYNASKVYGAFSTVHFTPGEPSAANEGRTYVEPGGTIYRPDADELYFPDGTAWGPARRAPFVSIDAHALTYDLTPEGAWPAAAALDAHARGQLALSYASGDTGRTYSPEPDIAVTQDTYKGREEYAAQQLASAWLTLHLAAWGPPTIDDTLYPIPGEAYHRQSPPPPRPPSP